MIAGNCIVQAWVPRDGIYVGNVARLPVHLWLVRILPTSKTHEVFTHQWDATCIDLVVRWNLMAMMVVCTVFSLWMS